MPKNIQETCPNLCNITGGGFRVSDVVKDVENFAECKIQAK